jgi:predicted metal-binding membrane protein
MDRSASGTGHVGTPLTQTPGPTSSVLETALRHDRRVVVGALVLVTLLAWGYLLSGAGMNMQSMDMNMVMPMDWSPGYALVMFLMWWIMMVAMMLPSAAPMILLFALVNRRNRGLGAPYVATTVFASGYLLGWAGFSLAATLVHWWLEQSGWLTMGMASANRWLSGILLIAAGAYQLSPLKHACLRHCRGPVDFIARHWRPGPLGALRMGLEHGTWCVGCCWVVMGLLFYGGVMNLYWIVGLAILVLAEKVLPPGHGVGNISGVGFLLWGGWLLL